MGTCPFPIESREKRLVFTCLLRQISLRINKTPNHIEFAPVFDRRMEK